MMHRSIDTIAVAPGLSVADAPVRPMDRGGTSLRSLNKKTKVKCCGRTIWAIVWGDLTDLDGATPWSLTNGLREYGFALAWWLTEDYNPFATVSTFGARWEAACP